MYVIGRPLLHEIIRRRVPEEKIHLGKRVISMEQDENGVKIHTADNHTYEGDILVGADGAYSIVRHHLYEKLQRDNKLSAHDNTPMPFRFVALIGQTVPLSPDNFPELLQEDSPFECIVGKNNYGVCLLVYLLNANTILPTISWLTKFSLPQNHRASHSPQKPTQYAGKRTSIWTRLTVRPQVIRMRPSRMRNGALRQPIKCAKKYKTCRLKAAMAIRLLGT